MTVSDDRGITFEERTVLVSTPPALSEMFTEVDDGAVEADIREAIQAAALATDWALANEIATRYSLAVCLRCAADVAYRPTWRLHRLGVKNNWGEVCGSCALKIIEESE